MIQNPYNKREFTGDKLTIVDVKAIDEKGAHYQIEIQLAIHAALSPRILYTWSSIYHSQIQEGENFQTLKPVISIWILNGNLFENVEACHLPFSLYDQKHQVVLTVHISIHLLQLPKWPSDRTITTEKERWIYLFKEGKNVDFDDLPDILNTTEMKTDYLRYQSCLEAVLKENTYIHELEKAKKEKEQEKREKEQVQEKLNNLLLSLKEKKIVLDDV